MKTKLVVFAILVLITSFVNAQIKFESINIDEAVIKAKKENKMIFVDVYASWCRPCIMLDQNVFPDKDIGDYFNKNFISVKIDGETTLGKQIMRDYELTAYPSMLFLNTDKEVIRKIVGYNDAEALLKQGKYAVDPSSNPAMQAQKIYDANPNRENHRNLINTYFDEDEDIYDISKSYLDKYPKLDLNESVDFIIFYYIEEDVNSLNFKEFLKNAEEGFYSENIVLNKISDVITKYILLAVEVKNINIVLDIVDIVFPAFSLAMEGEMTKDDLIIAIKELYYEYL